MTIITRFAPSPTGYLHVGGARTALFSYLYARKNKGKFILRIEDTDRERSTDESVQAIFEGMQWLGLEHDGEVFFQTKRFPQYKHKIQQLLDAGKAYYCTCSKERLETIREEQMKAGGKPRYDGKCRDLNLKKSDNAVIRFRNPQDGEVTFDDYVRGVITVANSELDDLIIARPDGTPTYNFTVVIDDIDMNISHVIRGDDHINNTPRQINIYYALDAKLPKFAHLPMILGDDGARLSKRHGAVGVMEYAKNGYLPEAVLNYLVRLGWSCEDKELFTKKEMIELFDLKKVNKAPSTFNTSKLNWINQQYIQQADSEHLADLLKQRLEVLNVHIPKSIDLVQVVEMFKSRAITINDMANSALFLFQTIDEYDEKAVKKVFKQSAIIPFETLIKKMQATQDWGSADLHALIEDTVNELEVGFGKVGQPLRVALTGQSSGPANDEIMYVLGKEETIKRTENALQFLLTKLKSQGII
ncbi:MAG TPA: glutamate--tRNA ligase [Oceanospirillales bacterium]|nr:glutamate--tRNA ligase [Oceanospirillales bacterium]